MNLYITNDTECVGNIWTDFGRSDEGELSNGVTGSKLVEILRFVLQKEEEEEMVNLFKNNYLNR